MNNAICSWCKEVVDEQDFARHSSDHLNSQKSIMSNNGQGSITSVSSVAYVVEN